VFWLRARDPAPVALALLFDVLFAPQISVAALALHAVSTGLVLVVISLSSGRGWEATVAAGLYAVAPAHLSVALLPQLAMTVALGSVALGLMTRPRHVVAALLYAVAALCEVAVLPAPVITWLAWRRVTRLSATAVVGAALVWSWRLRDGFVATTAAAAGRAVVGDAIARVSEATLLAEPLAAAALAVTVVIAAWPVGWVSNRVRIWCVAVVAFSLLPGASALALSLPLAALAAEALGRLGRGLRWL
jgi:hypothetical protein